MKKYLSLGVILLAVIILIFSMAVTKRDKAKKEKLGKAVSISLGDLLGAGPKYKDNFITLPAEVKEVYLDFYNAYLVQCHVYDDIDIYHYFDNIPDKDDLYALADKFQDLQSETDSDTTNYLLKTGKISPEDLKDPKTYAKLKKEIGGTRVNYDSLDSSGNGVIIELLVVTMDDEVIRKTFKTYGALDVLQFLGTKFGHDYFRDDSSRIIECRVFPMGGDDFTIGNSKRAKYWVLEESGYNCIIGGETATPLTMEYANIRHDKLQGGRHVDIIVARAGNDDISGYDGEDVLSGGYGWDVLDGGKGYDCIYGGFHADFTPDGYNPGQPDEWEFFDDLADSAN